MKTTLATSQNPFKREREREREISLEKQKKRETRGVSHCNLLAIYIEKYLNAKEELLKLKYFTKQKYNLQKNL